MLRKSLILGSITLLMVMLFALTGCEGPVGPAGDPGKDGDDGKPGKSGYDGNPAGLFYSGPNVSDEDLAAAFAKGAVVVLGSGVESVYGVVPAGKTLEVLGIGTEIKGGETLAVNDGTLDVSGEAILVASAVVSFPPESGVGALTVSGSAKIVGDGAIVLPYVLGGEFTAGLHFNSPELKTASSPFRYPGAVFQNDRTQVYPKPSYISDVPRRLAASDLPNIFLVEQTGDLTVYNLPFLEDDHISPNRKLTLKGTENTLNSGDFGLGGGAILVVAERAVLNSEGSSITVKEAAKIYNEGTIELGQTGRVKLPVVAGAGAGGDGSAFENNGTITFSPANNNDDWVKNVVGLWGSGTVVLTPQNGFELKRVAIRQNVTINANNGNSAANTITFKDDSDNDKGPFNGVEPGKIITIGKGVTLSLHRDSRSIGAKVVNNGTLITPTINTPEVLEYFWYEMDYKGKVEASGNLALIGKQDLVIPEGIELTISGLGTTLGSVAKTVNPDAPFDVVVKGTLILADNVALAPDNDVIVDASGSLKLGGGSLKPKGNVVINGSLHTGTGVFSNNDLALEIATGKSLEIKDSTKIGGGIGRIIVNNPLAFTIDGIPGFRARNDSHGVPGKDFQKALAGVLGAAEILKSDITLPPTGPDSPYNISSAAVSVIGTVELWNNSAAVFISHTPNAVDDRSRAIIVPDDTAVFTGVSNVDLGYDVHSDNTYFTQSRDFQLVVSGNEVCIVDTGYLSPGFGGVKGSYGYGVVDFNTIRFVNNDLIGPVLPLFKVGVKSHR
jgi:hypothetical protein